MASVAHTPHMHTRYQIVPTSEVKLSWFEVQCAELGIPAHADVGKLDNNDFSKCRKSLDGQYMILKYSVGARPSFLTSLLFLPKWSEFEHAFLVQTLQGPEWTDPDEEI